MMGTGEVRLGRGMGGGSIRDGGVTGGGRIKDGGIERKLAWGEQGEL